MSKKEICKIELGKYLKNAPLSVVTNSPLDICVCIEFLSIFQIKVFILVVKYGKQQHYSKTTKRIKGEYLKTDHWTLVIILWNSIEFCWVRLDSFLVVYFRHI